jgi:hypothetical protein
MLLIFSITSLRRYPVDRFRPEQGKHHPAWGTKNPVSEKEKQGPQKLRAMADPLLKKVPCPAPGHHLRILRPKALPVKHFDSIEFYQAVFLKARVLG